MPTGIPFAITDDVLAKIEEYASTGLTQTQIAHNLGVNESTFTRKKTQLTQVQQAIKRGRDKGIQKVTNALMENAMGGNLGAQCFYLKNVGKDDWRDRHDVEHSGKVGVFEVIDFTGDEPDDADEDTEESA